MERFGPRHIINPKNLLYIDVGNHPDAGVHAHFLGGSSLSLSGQDAKDFRAEQSATIGGKPDDHTEEEAAPASIANAQDSAPSEAAPPTEAAAAGAETAGAPSG